MKLATFLILGALMLPGQEPQTRKQKIDARKIETNERRERRAAETRARREASRAASAARSNRYQYGNRNSNSYRWTPQQIVASQEGSVAIAKNAGVTFDPISCLKTAKETLGSADKAATYCQKIFDREAKRSEEVANQAADATKSSRPLVILPRRGW